MADEDADGTARVVEAMFRGGNEVDDNDLTPDARMIFYTLENLGVLSTRREEYNLANGEHRRAFYWHFREVELARQATDNTPEMLPDLDVYDRLPAGAWSRASTA